MKAFSRLLLVIPLLLLVSVLVRAQPYLAVRTADRVHCYPLEDLELSFMNTGAEDSLVLTTDDDSRSYPLHGVARIRFLEIRNAIPHAPPPPSLPTSLHFDAPWPNPVNAAATVKVALPVAGRLRLVVYNELGREVMSPADRSLPAGEHLFTLDLSGLASGVYFMTASVNGQPGVTRRLTLIK